MHDHDLSKYFKQGDIIAYYNDKDNAKHHSTNFGKLIEVTQTVFWSMTRSVDTRVTHLALLDQPHPEPAEPGYTSMWSYDILIDKVVERRKIEHNYSLLAFRLRRDLPVHPKFTSEEFAAKAVEVAHAFQGTPYKKSTLLDVFADWSKHEGSVPGVDYTQWLVKRFQLDKGSVQVDKNDGVICPELVMLSYQLAYLLLAGEKAMREPLPLWLSFHAQCTPAGLIHFFARNPFFEKIDPDHMDLLRYSGTPDPRDLEMQSYLQNTQRRRAKL